MRKDRYSVNIVWSEEDGEFVATCPSFPGLSAFGATREEAVREGEVVLAGMIESCEERGDALPLPFVITGYDGRDKPEQRVPKN